MVLQILEQVEGGDLIVNRGDESRPKETDEKRDLNAVEGFEAALKLAQVKTNYFSHSKLADGCSCSQANLDEVIKRNVQPPATTASAQNPTTYSYVYLRIQPFFTTLPQPQQSAPSPAEGDASPPAESESRQQLQFILYMSDPSHQLTHSTVTQAVPGKWLELWDRYDWVEDLVVEAIRVGVEVIGQEYIVSRMGWDKKVASGDGEGREEEGEQQVPPPTVSVTEAA